MHDHPEAENKTQPRERRKILPDGIPPFMFYQYWRNVIYFTVRD